LTTPDPSGGGPLPPNRFTNICVLVATVCGSSLAIIDATAINVALPAIQDGLDADITSLQWVIESYALFLGALILVGGVLGDHFGRKRMFAIGVIIFASASAWCGLAEGVMQLIVARGFQGIGAALVVPGSLALLSAHFPQEQRGPAIGQWASFTTLAIVLGPLLGGVLVDTASWRWVFFINLPIAAILLFVLYLGVPESRNESQAGKLDIVGAAFITLGLGGLVFGLLESAHLGFSALEVWGSITAGIVIILAFIYRQMTVKFPMLPLDLFRSRAFSGANIMTFLLYGAMTGCLFFLPFNLMQVHGWSATEAGAALLPLILLISLFSFAASKLVAKLGQRIPLTSGACIAALGFALLALPSNASGYWSGFLPGIAVLGLGLGIAVAPLTIVVMGAVPTDRSGLASGVNNAASRVAMLMAVAIFGVVMFEIFSSQLQSALQVMPLDNASRIQISERMVHLSGLQPPDGLKANVAEQLHVAVGESFVAGFRAVSLIAAGAALAGGLIAGLTIPPRADVK